MSFSNWISIHEYEPPNGKIIEVMYKCYIPDSDCYKYTIENATRIKRYLRTKVFEEYWISKSNDIKQVSYWRYISE